jgi:hypothetical protein
MRVEAEKAARRAPPDAAAQPGVAVEVEKLDPHTYRMVAPHEDTSSWRDMICDAFRTRSAELAKVFLHQLSHLCSMLWVPGEDGMRGEYVSDECALNAMLGMVTSLRPRDAGSAALVAQVLAVHLMTMRASEATLACANEVTNTWMDDRTAAVAGKLARPTM